MSRVRNSQHRLATVVFRIGFRFMETALNKTQKSSLNFATAVSKSVSKTIYRALI